MKRWKALGLTLAASGLSACEADESVLDAVFSCDPEAGDVQCGTDENGKPMTCYVGSAQLGGKAFCTKTCDRARHEDRGTSCTSSGALLARCNPGENASGCRSPLNCYRTDLLFDEGVCLWVPVCPYGPDETGPHDNRQCGISRRACAGDILREAASGSEFECALRTNNLHCVTEPPCDMFGCPATPLPEACPSESYRTMLPFPITCAAECDRFTCPPNFTCTGGSSLDAPPVCLPGLLGMRCASDDDCMTGDCFDAGAGFAVCALPAAPGPCDGERP